MYNEGPGWGLTDPGYKTVTFVSLEPRLTGYWLQGIDRHFGRRAKYKHSECSRNFFIDVVTRKCTTILKVKYFNYFISIIISFDTHSPVWKPLCSRQRKLVLLGSTSLFLYHPGYIHNIRPVSETVRAG